MKMKFYKCEICGNMVAVVKESGEEIFCCGMPMKQLKANSVDAVFEKHVPVFTVENNKVHVTVGETAHPMTEWHSIEWIAIQTTGGNQRKELKPGDEPKACFALCEGEKLLSVYACCNLHGLWKSLRHEA